MVAATYRNMETTPLWIVAAHEAASRGTTASGGLPVPGGMQGSFNVRCFGLKDGSVRWSLVFRDRRTRKQTQVARWIGDTLPELNGGANSRKPVSTHGKPVVIDADDRTGDVCAKVVRVVIDEDGLPMPVPEVMLRRSTAEQVAEWLRSLGVVVDWLRVLEVQQRMATA